MKLVKNINKKTCKSQQIARKKMTIKFDRKKLKDKIKKKLKMISNKISSN
jgi:hypothetical protein